MTDNINIPMSQSRKLTKWSNEPSVLDLKEDLRMAEPAHDSHVQEVDNWLNLRNIEGSAKPKTMKNRSQVQPKLIRRQAEWRYSALSEPFLGSDKLFKISPTTWEDTEAARQNELVINWQFRTKMNKVRFIDEVVRTFVDEGSVAIRLGWHRVTEMVEVESPVWEFYPIEDPMDPRMEGLAQALEMRTQNYNEFLNLPEDLQEAAEYTLEAEIPVYAVQVGIEIVEEEQVRANYPTADTIAYQNIYVDPSAEGDIKKASFAIISFETSKAEMIKDGRYKNLDKVLWSSNSPLANPEHDTFTDDTVQFKDDLRKRVVAYEYWGWYDVEGNDELKPIVATWIGDVMVRMEENPFPDQEIPVVIVPYMPLKKSIWGEPDAELLSENQAILGAVTRGMIDLMGRSANGQKGFAKGMLDTANRRKYENGHDYEYNPTMQPSMGVYEHKFPEIPNSALTMLQVQNQEAEALTGVKAFSGGLSGQAYGDVAAGIKGMLDAASKREMAILRRLAQGIEEMGRKIIKMNQVFLTEEEVVRVTNDEFVTVRREDLKGDFDLKVDISTAEVDAAQAEDLSFMLQTMGNSMDFSMTQIILAEIARLKRMPDLAKRIEQFQPQPDPLQEQAKQLELQKLQLEVAELESKVQLNQAKARKELADAEMSDLNYVEQETGTKHLRDLDRQRAQSEGNQQLAITKGILDKDNLVPGKPSDANIGEAIAYDRIQEVLTNQQFR